jgi:hypothetical protein
MSEVRAESLPVNAAPAWREFFGKEDWWAIWIGVGLVLAAIALLASGSSIKWLAVAPQNCSHPAEVVAQLREHALQFAGVLVNVVLGYILSTQVFGGFWAGFSP